MLLKGKKGLILGIGNQDSISWGVAKKALEAGAGSIITYQTDTLKRRVEPLTQTLHNASIFLCDVEDSEKISDLFHHIRRTWGSLDFMLHGAAYSDKQELTGKFLDTTKNNFHRTLHISCFSFIEMVREAADIPKI